MKTWQRCPDSTFYRDVDEEAGEFRLTFVDPIAFVLVNTTPWKSDRTVSVSFREVLSIKPSAFKILEKSEARRLSAWMRRVVESTAGGTQGWKRALLDDLDVDALERDELLGAIEVFIYMYDGVREDGYKVSQDLDEVQEVLSHFGVRAC